MELRLREISQLFDSLDPSPFHEKDLDRHAEEYLIASVKELHPKRPLELVIYVDRPSADLTQENSLPDAVHSHFLRKAKLSRLELRQLLRRGWISLVIGICFLSGAMIAGEFIKEVLSERAMMRMLGEGLYIGGWVAMWYPIEIFLYRWWPIVGNQRVFEHLSRIPVRLVFTKG